MKINLVAIILGLTSLFRVNAQTAFDYSVILEPVAITGLPGLHSFAHAQHNGKWLIVGGRKDGIHARQPFNSFPATQNNTDLMVIDVQTQQFWSASLSSLPTPIAEQLQATNMNYFQDNDTLYLIGGYAYSANAADHITFSNLTTIQVSSVIDAIVNGTPFQQYFKQISDSVFAVCGGQLGKIDDTFYLVGGQKFDGRYNPMGHATYVQTYTNQVRKFQVNNSGSQLSFNNFSAITDPVHLRRRDYNLLPQVFPDGSRGYTISSGVFQATIDMPFLYPVDISANGVYPVTAFNQYLSNYHSAKVSLYDAALNKMHSIFFGGMSQYYYQNGTLLQDNTVPFVKTISMVTRNADSTLQEFLLPIEMPALKGSSAEFIAEYSAPHYDPEIVQLDAFTQDTTLIGYIYGGIESPINNAFSINATSSTSADNSIYAVSLIKNTSSGIAMIKGSNPYKVVLYPNPTDTQFNADYELSKPVSVNYFITTSNGELLSQVELGIKNAGKQHTSLSLNKGLASQKLYVTFVFDNKYFVTEELIKK